MTMSIGSPLDSGQVECRATRPSGARSRSPGTTCRRRRLLGFVSRSRAATGDDRLGVRLGAPAHERRLRSGRPRSSTRRPRAWPAAPSLRSRARRRDRRGQRPRALPGIGEAAGRCGGASVGGRRNWKDLWSLRRMQEGRTRLRFAPRDGLLLVGAHEHREVVEQVPNLGGVHPRPSRRHPRPNRSRVRARSERRSPLVIGGEGSTGQDWPGWPSEPHHSLYTEKTPTLVSTPRRSNSARSQAAEKPLGVRRRSH